MWLMFEVVGYRAAEAAGSRMCDHHHLPSQSSLGEIDHVNFLSDNIGTLFMQEDYSDVTLIVENQRFPVHKVVLAARSDYFR